MARNSPQFFVLIASAASSPRTSATSLTRGQCQECWRPTHKVRPLIAELQLV
jgi:hypothetical protein